MTDRSRNVEETLPPGTRLEEFVIEQGLQSGGFGVTYLAQDESLGRRVAIKEYLPLEWAGRRADGSVGPRSASQAQDYEWGLARFLDEARMLARLDHGRIVRVYRVIEAWGTAYMVMEYVAGWNLEETLKTEGPWPEERVRGLLESLLPGVALVHEAGLVHRDIKPSNVMLRSDGTPVLIDFGAARYAAGVHSRSLTSVLTPGYAPDEQYHMAGKQGPWTDVYALGAVAYRALSGHVPVEAPARVHEIAQRRSDPLAPVASASAGPVSESFGSAVTAALAVWPEGRPPDVGAWRARWDGGPVVRPPPSVVRPPRPAPTLLQRILDWIRGADHRAAYGAAALVVGAAVAVGMVTRGGESESVPMSRVVVDPPGAEAAEAARLAAEAELRAARAEAARHAAEAEEEAARRAEAERRAAEAEEAVRLATAEAELRAAEAEAARRAAEAAAVEPEAVENALGLDRAAWRLIQTGLAYEGFDPGSADGSPGRRTRAALARWQQARAFDATGYLTDASARALRNAGAIAIPELSSRGGAGANLEAEADVDRHADGEVFRDCDFCPEMVVIPAGAFQMGSGPEDDEAYPDEKPRHRVTVGRFALGLYEVTREEYAAFVTATGHDSGDEECVLRTPRFAQDGHPVACASWRDAQAYAAWLSQETGASYGLPSEAEWEYAARAGTATRRYWGDSSSAQCEYANGADEAAKRRNSNLVVVVPCDDRSVYTAAAGSYAKNAFGLFDMLGNVWEWTEDCWHDRYSRGVPTDGSAWTSGGDCSRHVLRGGAWGSSPRHLRSANRRRSTPGLRHSSAGFRVARTLD